MHGVCLELGDSMELQLGQRCLDAELHVAFHHLRDGARQPLRHPATADGTLTVADDKRQVRKAGEHGRAAPTREPTAAATQWQRSNYRKNFLIGSGACATIRVEVK